MQKTSLQLRYKYCYLKNENQTKPKHTYIGSPGWRRTWWRPRARAGRSGLEGVGRGRGPSPLPPRLCPPACPSLFPGGPWLTLHWYHPTLGPRARAALALWGWGPTTPRAALRGASRWRGGAGRSGKADTDQTEEGSGREPGPQQAAAAARPLTGGRPAAAGAPAAAFPARPRSARSPMCPSLSSPS